MTDKPLLISAKNAAATIIAVYTWLDRVNAAGGATSLSGMATCNAMLKSLEKERQRVESLILQPLRKAIVESEA